MFWIVLGIIGLLAFIVGLIISEKINEDIAVFIGGVGIIIFLVGGCGSINFIAAYAHRNIEWDEECYKRDQLIQRGQMLSQDNSTAIQLYVADVQKFNEQLFKTQTLVKYRKNTFTYHDERYLTMEPINIDNLKINVPTSKIILEQ